MGKLRPHYMKPGETRIQTTLCSHHICSSRLHREGSLAQSSPGCPSPPHHPLSRTHTGDVPVEAPSSLPHSLGFLPPPSPQPLPSQQEWGWLLPVPGTSPPPHPETGCQSPPWGQHPSALPLPWGSRPAKRQVGMIQVQRPSESLIPPHSPHVGCV